MTTLIHDRYWQQCRAQPFYMKWALLTTVVFSFAVFNYIALTNVSMLLMLMAAPFAWWAHHTRGQTLEPREATFLWLIVVFCAWDVSTNLLAGYGWGPALRALLEMRTFGFVVLLWALFSQVLLARTAATRRALGRWTCPCRCGTCRCDASGSVVHRIGSPCASCPAAVPAGHASRANRA